MSDKILVGTTMSQVFINKVPGTYLREERHLDSALSQRVDLLGSFASCCFHSLFS